MKTFPDRTSFRHIAERSVLRRPVQWADGRLDLPWNGWEGVRRPDLELGAGNALFFFFFFTVQTRSSSRPDDSLHPMSWKRGCSQSAGRFRSRPLPCGLDAYGSFIADVRPRSLVHLDSA